MLICIVSLLKLDKLLDSVLQQDEIQETGRPPHKTEGITGMRAEEQLEG
jgi:hypothetical protein